MFRKIILSAGVLAAMSSATYAADWGSGSGFSGFYIGANGGWAETASPKVKNTGTDTGDGGFGTGLTNGALPTSINDNASGFLGGGQLGYNWQPNDWLIGLEADFDGASINHSVKSVYLGGAFGPDTSFYNRDLHWLSTVRARLGIVEGSSFLFYATGGVAIADTKVGSSVSCPGFGPPCSTEASTTASSSSTRFGPTVGAGVEWMVGSNWSVKAEYLYALLGKQHDTVVYTYGPTSSMTSTFRNSLNIVRVGINYHFNEPPPPLPAPPPPAPPPPPPAPVKNFIVFFDFNKSNLTSDALPIVQDAVKTAKSGSMVKVLITGHTDTVGSHSYNQGLSERRADSVKDEMVREGMDGSDISTVGKSFDDPLVPTGPGVREPQNRRAVIALGDNAGM